MGRLVASAPRRPDSAEIRGVLLLCGRSREGWDTKRAQQDPGHGAGRAEPYRPSRGPLYVRTGLLYEHVHDAACDYYHDRTSGPPTSRSPSPLVVHPSLAGEGKWQATGPLADGVPGMYVAQFRADDIYTSQITSAVWIDTKLLRVELVPGSTEPGGTWVHPPFVTPAELPYLVAAFNGGFRFDDARGGIYLEGKWGVPPVRGAASLVIYKDGQVNIGDWGTDVAMSPDVQAVLQNVVLLVDNGQLAPSATYTDNAIWGYTLGGGYVVPRSGVGVTADGALVYVAGPALTARSLAESLQRAGAVRAMTLDINPEWVTFNFYSHVAGHPREVNGTKLYPQMQRSADRYLPFVSEAPRLLRGASTWKPGCQRLEICHCAFSRNAVVIEPSGSLFKLAP